jgi:hypothetical protein
MSLSRDNPLSIEAVGDFTQTIPEQIRALADRIRDVDNANAGWTKKQLGYIKSRFGKRKRKKVPWVGASNINVPLVDGIIRRWRPGITSLILDANPVAFFVAREANDFDPARVVEPFFTWLFVEHMETPPELMRLVDLIATRGHAYTREGWKYETTARARIVRAEDIFPGGIGRFLEGVNASIEAAAQAGETPEGPISDEVKVANELANQYGMDMQDPEEQQMLLAAATALIGGADKIKITYEEVEHDRPDWCAIDPVNVITERSGDPEKADFFAIIHELSEDELIRGANDGRFEQSAVAALLQKMADVKRDQSSATNRSGGAGGSMARQSIRDFMDRRANVSRIDIDRTKSKKIQVWETFCRLDINTDGLSERCVMWYAPEFDIPLLTTQYTMPFNDWPITLFKFEPHAETPTDSRGIPELLSDLAKLVNAFHNARVDAAQIVLAPVLQRVTTGSDYGQRIQWRPGAIIPTRAQGDISPIVHDLRILTGLLQEEQHNQRIAEGFIGTFDATINQLNQPTERRTAAEVNAITQLAQNVFGLDARMFQVSMGRSFKKIWKLWQEFGPTEIFFRVTNERQPQLALKSEMDHDFDIAPAGTPSSTNKAFLLSNMERILQIIITDQSGRFDSGALLEKYFQLIDLNLAKTIVRSPEQTAAAQAVQQAAAAAGLENPLI